MHKHILCYFLLALTLVFGACSPEDEPAPRPPLADNSAILPFLEQHKPQRQTFQVNAQTPDSVMGSLGTKVIFGAQAFFRPDGSPANGQVEIEMIEIYQRDDMIYSQLPPVFNNRLLVSAGEIYLKATQQGTELRVSNTRMQVPQVDTIAASSPMELFTGRGSTDVSWQRPASGDTILVDYVPADSSGTSTAYFEVSFTNDVLGWINVAHINQSATARAVNGKLQGIGNYNGFVVYCVYGGNVRSVSPFSVHDNGDIFSAISLPDLIPVTLVAIGNQDGRYYYGTKQFESGPVEIYHLLDVQEISEPELVAALDSL